MVRLPSNIVVATLIALAIVGVVTRLGPSVKGMYRLVTSAMKEAGGLIISN